MKFFILLSLLVASTAIAKTETFETRCKNQDCFTYGWVTSSSLGYVMDTRCKKQDCTQYGWHSVANDKSTYDVECRAGGCFVEGWASVQNIRGKIYNDEITCKYSNCLTHGWTVRTGYDPMGGNVTCNENDCSKFGGKSFWRGRFSQTKCYSGDCYKNGWTLLIYR